MQVVVGVTRGAVARGVDAGEESNFAPGSYRKRGNVWTGHRRRPAAGNHLTPGGPDAPTVLRERWGLTSGHGRRRGPDLKDLSLWRALRLEPPVRPGAACQE